MITITIVRHGQSVDNNGNMWAGHRDSALSVNGMAQAVAVGKSFKDTKFDAIFHSNLKRAQWTAEQIYSYQPEPKPSMTSDGLLREQHFGEGEGKPWAKGGGFEWTHDRRKAFKGGECSEDVRVRANEAIAKYIEPLLEEARGKPPSHKHIAIVAHGIFNTELLGALFARLPKDEYTRVRGGGMANTGWHRLEVGYRNETSFDESAPILLQSNQNEPIDPTSGAGEPSVELPTDESLPKLRIQKTALNNSGHLEDLKYQKGDIGRGAFDPKQQDLRAFFGGSSKV